MGFEFHPGLYRHYKGGIYRALFTTTHHETGEIFVVYVSQDHMDSGMKIRELLSPRKDSWNDSVDWGKGVMKPRFERIGS